MLCTGGERVLSCVGVGGGGKGGGVRNAVLSVEGAVYVLCKGEGA